MHKRSQDHRPLLSQIPMVAHAQYSNLSLRWRSWDPPQDWQRCDVREDGCRAHHFRLQSWKDFSVVDHHGGKGILYKGITLDVAFNR